MSEKGKPGDSIHSLGRRGGGGIYDDFHANPVTYVAGVCKRLWAAIRK